MSTTDDQLDQDRSAQLMRSIQEATEAFEEYLYNRFDSGLKRCQAKSNENMYLAVAQSYMHLFQALVSMEADIMQNSLEHFRKAEKLCRQNRKSNTIAESIRYWIGSVECEKYTDEEAHAEICFAEVQTMNAIVTFFATQSIYTLFKVAFQIKSANETYKLCNRIRKEKLHWSTEELRSEFVAGVQTGIGIMNLILSHLPDKLVRLISMAGFSGNFEKAQHRINEALSFPSLRNVGLTFFIVGYHLYVCQILGSGEDIHLAEQFVRKLRERFPNAAMALFMDGRIQRLKGNQTEAIQLYEESIAAQSQMKQIHSICYWDLIWCHGLTNDWENAAKCALKLKESSDWAPSTFAYEAAVFTYMQMQETKDTSLKETIDKEMRFAVDCRKRYIGKTFPHDKLAIKRAEEYLSGKSQPSFLSVCEMYYIWNVLTSLESKPNILESILQRLSELNLNENTDNTNDDHSRATLFKGVCLRILGRFQESIQCFETCLSLKASKSTYVSPHAAMEIGLTYMKTGQYDLAKEWLEKAQKNYQNYLIESAVHIRVHAALKAIKQAQPGGEASK